MECKGKGLFVNRKEIKKVFLENFIICLGMVFGNTRANTHFHQPSIFNMKKLLPLLGIALLPYFAHSQGLHADLHLGVANYQGDLQTKKFTFKGAKPAVGLGLSYDVSNHFVVRGLASFMTVSGADRNTNGIINPRNLDFTSRIWEAQLGVEYNILDITERSFTPYVFAGVAAFHFNPYSHDSSGNKFFLRSLGTEGQGLAQYPDKKLYKNNQLSIPFGGGVKFAFTDKLQVGIEVGLRKLFTDYLDDVSGTYADSTILANARGPQAVAFAYRESEIHGPSTYPREGAVRGNPDKKDWYYVTGLHISYLLGNGNGGGGGRGGGKNKLGCPANVF